MRNKTTAICLAAAAACFTIGVTGCGDDSKVDADGAKGSQIDRSAPRVISFNDGFPNVAFKCNGTTGIYVTTREDDDSNVVPNDPECGATSPANGGR